MLEDLEAIRAETEENLSTEEREERLADRRKEEERQANVNKLDVDPFPDCLAMKMKLLREEEEKKRRDVVDWLDRVRHAFVAYKQYTQGLAGRLEKTVFDGTAASIEERIANLAEEDQEVRAENRAEFVKAVGLWDDVPPQMSEGERAGVKETEAVALEWKEGVEDAIEKRRRNAEAALEAAKEAEERQSKRAAKIKSHKDKWAKYRSWVEAESEKLANTEISLANVEDIAKVEQDVKKREEALRLENAAKQGELKDLYLEIVALEALEEELVDVTVSEDVEKETEKIDNASKVAEERLRERAREFVKDEYERSAKKNSLWATERGNEVAEIQLKDTESVDEGVKQSKKAKVIHEQVQEHLEKQKKSLALLWKQCEERQVGEDSIEETLRLPQLIASFDSLEGAIRSKRLSFLTALLEVYYFPYSPLLP